jgi:response regulator RpfG family c-di-GMP phosphodiesterase
VTTSDPGRILLVDHHKGVLLFQETILRRRESIIFTALAGSEGIEKAKREKPHLIIFGYDLFDMSAPEFCRAIRDESETRTTSLLLVADPGHTEHADLCLSAGCNDVIYRPLRRPDLDQKVTKLTRIPVRRQLRTMTRIELSIENNNRFLLGRSINISSNGMLFEIDRVLPGDGPLRVHFYLPGDAKPLQLEALVLRAEFAGTMARYGVHFVNTTEEERGRIHQYVHRLRARELI